jgi:PAS domain S-box-containing protein
MERHTGEHQKAWNDLVFRAGDLHGIRDCFIIAIDGAGTIAAWNTGASETFGFSSEEMIHLPITALHLIFDKTGDAAHPALFSKRVPPASEEWTGVHKDGHRIHLRLTPLPLHDEEGAPWGSLLIGKDLTQDKNAEEILRISEMRYRSLFLTSKDGVLILDAATGRIIDANPYLIDKLGFTLEELQKKNIWEISPPQFSDMSKGRFNELREKGFIHFDDIPLITSDRRTIDAEFVSNVYLVEDTRVIQCNIRDVTERKKNEKALRENEDKLKEQNILLEQKNAALREIMSQHQNEKERIESQVQANVDRLMKPVIEKLKGTGNPVVERYIELLEADMKEITSRFGNTLSSKMFSLTQREIDICNMIKNGFSSKQISQALNISTRTIETHRNSIRKKLDISGKKVNLATYLKFL